MGTYIEQMQVKDVLFRIVVGLTVLSQFVVPLVVFVIFNQGCGQGWLKTWCACPNTSNACSSRLFPDIVEERLEDLRNFIVAQPPGYTNASILPDRMLHTLVQSASPCA